MRGQILATTLVMRTPSSERINAEFERFLLDVKKHLDWLDGSVQAWNTKIPDLVIECVTARRNRAQQVSEVAAGLKFDLKPRTGDISTFCTSITPRQKIMPQMPRGKPSAPPEPVLSDVQYDALLKTLQSMSEGMELSPHAYAGMDEETLRFQFLIPLNAHYEGSARGEVFNYKGKTDILITENGKNIFIAECKVWKGAKALSDAVDQLLGYLSWRDTKTAILLFNRNRSFSEVLAQIRPTMEQHPQYVSFDKAVNDTMFSFTFVRPDDNSRKINLTVLAFDVPIDMKNIPKVQVL